jgi:single-strand DNA-binding protein
MGNAKIRLSGTEWLSGAKGRTVLVEGRLQTRSWEDKSGQKRYTTEVVAQNVKFVGGGRGESAGASYGQQGQGAGSYGDHDSFDMAPDQGFGGPDTPSLDEIPF